MKIYNYLFALILVTTLVSCGRSTAEILEANQLEIEEYLEENGLLDQAQLTSTGFYYIIDEPGDPNLTPSLNSLITCAYNGFYPDGEVFDAHPEDTFVLGKTIEGWRQGIPLIGEGGSVQLFIPSFLGYGTAGRGSIPGNQVLIFEVDLLDVQ